VLAPPPIAPTDPFSCVHAGDVVLDLASGDGETCCYLAHRVGPEGRVIGAESNSQLLASAGIRRKLQSSALGWDNIEFLRARPHDLALDLTAAEDWLQKNPIHDLTTWSAFEDFRRGWTDDHPLIANVSIDLVLCRGVLNFHPPHQRTALLKEVFRVLKPHGRLLIAEIVSDRPLPTASPHQFQMWGESISGASDELTFLQLLSSAGFNRTELIESPAAHRKTIEGIRFQPVTFLGYRNGSSPESATNDLPPFESAFATESDSEHARGTSCCYRSGCC